MPLCCDAMEAEMKRGATIILDRASGAGMTVRYLLPRLPTTASFADDQPLRLRSAYR
jgi:hypothetical protein